MERQSITGGQKQLEGDYGYQEFKNDSDEYASLKLNGLPPLTDNNQPQIHGLMNIVDESGYGTNERSHETENLIVQQNQDELRFDRSLDSDDRSAKKKRGVQKLKQVGNGQMMIDNHRES